MTTPVDPISMLPVQDLDLSAATADRVRPHALQPCLFIDKDGTLIENVPYNVDPAQVRFMPGAGSALARLAAAGLKLVIVTNQSGLARGYFTRAQFAQLQEALLRRLRAESEVTIDDVMLCPHEADAQGRPACLCRKPAPGMLISAARRHGLDLTRSWMVGDTLDDVEAGRRAGARGLLFDSGGETVWRRSPLREPDAVFTDWSALASHVLSELSGQDSQRAGAGNTNDANATKATNATNGRQSPTPTRTE